MIKGGLKVRLTKQSVLSMISEYDIFKYYMPNEWKLNKTTHSPFRKEHHPSFLIGDRQSKLYFIDFADSGKRGDCFEFVRLLFNFPSIKEALERIDVDFGLGIGTGVAKKDYKRDIVSKYEQPNIEDSKSYSLIQVVTRKFTNRELEYWNSYHQSEDDLKANNVYAIKKVFLNRQVFNIAERDMVFGYLYDRCWKIYRPLNPRESKWMPNNVPLSTSWGLNNLKSDKNTLVCKSLKDYMVCKKIYENVCGVQNESISAFSEETVNHIKENSNIVYYGGDSDAPGKEASFAITKAFNFKHINPPNRLLPDIKDFAEWAKLKGLQEVKNHFVQKGLFGDLK